MTVAQTWAAERTHRAVARKAARSRRTPLLTSAVRVAARHLPSWERLRTTVTQITAIGLIDFGLFEVNTVAGFIGTGLSLLVLDAFSGSEQGQGQGQDHDGGRR